MNFSFYIFGTPGGYDQHPADDNSALFQEFAKSNTAESQLTVKREGNLVHYVYVRQLQKESEIFFGLCLSFNGVHCRNPKGLFELFSTVFDDVYREGRILKYDNFKISYNIGRFNEDSTEVKRIKSFFKKKLEENLARDFSNILPTFKTGNGSKTISIKEDKSVILDNIAEYEVVHLSKNEKLPQNPNKGMPNRAMAGNDKTIGLSTKRKIIYFSSSFVFFFIVFYCQSDNAIVLNLILPMLTLLVFSFMYAVSGIHHKKFYKPADYLFPLYISLTVSFGLISLIFGIHTEVFTSYDKDRLGFYSPWKWMKVNEILNFPKEQIKSIDSPPSQLVNFSGLIKKDTACHIIIIDKTQSVRSSGEKVDSFLRDKIRSTFNVTDSKLNSVKTSDLIPPYILSGFYNNVTSSSCEYVSMWHYNGNKELSFIDNNTDSYTTDIASEIRSGKSKFINNYFDEINKFEHVSSQKSQIDDIIVELNKIIVYPDFEKHNSIKVSIISDFLNSSNIESGLDFQEVEKLTQLNLYYMDGFDGDNPTCSPIEILDKATNNYSLIKPKKIINLKDKEQASFFFEELSLSNYQYFDYRNKSSIEFFYPYRSYNTKEKASAYIHFLEVDLKKNESKKYKIKLVDDGNKNDAIPIIYKSGRMSELKGGLSGDRVDVNVFKDDTLEIGLPFTNSLTSINRLYLEVSSLSDHKTEALSVVLRPRMPDTTSYYLIFCYAIFIMSIALFLILPNVFVFRLMLGDKLISVSKTIDALNILALSLPVSLGLFWAVFLFTTFHDLNDLILHLSTVLFVLLGFCLPRYFYNYRKYHNKTGKLYSFNLLGSFISDIKFFMSPKI